MRTFIILAAAILIPSFLTGCTSTKEIFRNKLINLDRSIQRVNSQLHPNAVEAKASRNIVWKPVFTDNLAKETDASMQADWLGGIVPGGEMANRIQTAATGEASATERYIEDLMTSEPEVYGSVDYGTSYDTGSISYSEPMSSYAPYASDSSFSSGDSSIPMYSGPSDSSSGGYETYSSSTPTYYSEPTTYSDSGATGYGSSYDSVPMYSGPNGGNGGGIIGSGGTAVGTTYSAPAPTYSQPAYSSGSTGYSTIPNFQSQPSYQLKRRPYPSGSGAIYRDQFGTRIYQ